MKSAIYLSLLSLVAGSLPVQADQSVDQSLPAPMDGKVRIYNTRGEVNIQGWDEAMVHVKGKLDDLTREFVFDVAGDLTTIRIEMKKRPINYGDGSDLDIYLPRGQPCALRGGQHGSRNCRDPMAASISTASAVM